MIMRALAILLALMGAAVSAQEFSGLARPDPETSVLRDTRNGGLEIVLGLSQGVPFRIFTLDEPRRLVLDFREVDWRGIEPATLNQSNAVKTVRMGQFRPGWSRMVVEFEPPFLFGTADMTIDRSTGQARLDVVLTEGDDESFAAAAGAPEGALWSEDIVMPPKPGDARFVIVLDPGHGGIDPGADQGGVLEKEVMLTFAHELREVLLRSGDVDVVLTREDDRFVSLDERVSIAHKVRGDLFISLHADAVSEGMAHGATVYTLSDSASDAASAALAERHDRADILSGVDLSSQGDVVAGVLMDLARLETAPRSEQLAEALRLGIEKHGLRLNRRPLRAASFSVLRSPSVPSVLLEVGFLSSETDRGNLVDPAWRAEMAHAVRDAIFAWRQADAARSELVRQ